jgi:hypothetical protein
VTREQRAFGFKIGDIVRRKVLTTEAERAHGKKEHGQVLSLFLSGGPNEGKVSVTWWGIKGVPGSATQARHVEPAHIERVPPGELRVSGSGAA